MNLKTISKLMIVALVVFGILAACAGSPATEQNTSTENESGTPAMVDGVTVEQRERQYYAVVNGNYPDPCTFISSVEQVVEGSTINITLLTKSPDDLMCAAVLTPFTVDILLTTGGLLPQEYTVVINGGPSATFSLGNG